jgi:hypothetical protein
MIRLGKAVAQHHIQAIAHRVKVGWRIGKDQTPVRALNLFPHLQVIVLRWLP